MNRSESISKLAAALVKAQSEIKKAHLDADNPFYNSRYATLESVHDASHEALTKNDISVLQTPTMFGSEVALETTLLHSSGEFYSSTVVITPKDPKDPQKVGSSITYYRRFSLAGFLNIVQEDDDANKASQPAVEKSVQVPAKVIVKNATQALKAAPVATNGKTKKGILSEEQKAELTGAAHELGWDDIRMADEFKKLTGKANSTLWTAEDHGRVVNEMKLRLAALALKDVPETIQEKANF